MDRYYFKPLGLEYCQVWLQNRIQHLPPFKIYFSIPLYLFFYPFSYLAGSFIPHPFESGGSSSSRPRKDGLLLSTVPGQKTQWIESADHKFEIPKQLHHLQAISHGIGKSRRSKTSDPLLQKKNLHYSPRSYENPGSSYGLPSIRNLEPEPLSHSTELDPPFLEPENLGIGQKDHHSILGKKRSAMVVGGKASGKRGSLALPSVSYHHDRCKQSGLGSSLPLALRPGILDPFTSKETIKLSGTTSRLGSLKDQPSLLLKNQHVHILTDNTTVVSYLRRQGGTRSIALSSLTRTIFSWAEENILSLSATHLKGVLNTEADFLSRRVVSPNEWCLNQEIFCQLTDLCGTPRIDLFATRENSLCHLYFSLEAREPKDRLDAFSHPWIEPLSYAFPPIPLVARVLRKILMDQARVILICPNWPKKSWYPLLTSLALRQPVILPPRKDLLHQGPILHPDPEKLQLAAWILSPTS
ncbi:uncharacterized protein [Engystomops pustulosus]|uniref:uncharacterized protein n=1 Tax=Engystomops pustulosus TaxID=76066 RepID=UPI003AFA07AF